MASSTLDKALVAPSKVFMDVTASQSTWSEDYGTGMVYERDSHYFYIAWLSKYTRYQVRWRKRTRTRPTAEKAGGWSGWGAWSGGNQDWDKWGAPNAGPTSSSVAYSANQPVYKHHLRIVGTALGTYDAEQWQVQVRAFSTGSLKHGNTASATFTMYHAPTSLTIDRAVLDNDGGILVYYTTNWNRNGNTVAVEFTGTERRATVENVKGGLTGTYFKIPVGSLDRNYDVGSTLSANFEFHTADGGGASAGLGFSGPVESMYSNTIQPTMALTLDPDSHTATVTLSESGRDYPWLGTKVWAGWTGPDGKWRTIPAITVSEDLSGRTGTYRFRGVPSDIAVRYRAYVYTADSDAEPDLLQKTGTMRSNGRAYLSIGDRWAGLVCAMDEAGVTWGREYSPNMEAETCAGRERPVSRHGVGGSASVQVRGDIVYDTAAHDMGEGFRLADWEAMKRRTGADGYLSLPQGVWAKVAVRGIDIETAWPAHSVTLDLEEVV